MPCYLRRDKSITYKDWFGNRQQKIVNHGGVSGKIQDRLTKIESEQLEAAFQLNECPDLCQKYKLVEQLQVDYPKINYKNLTVR